MNKLIKKRELYIILIIVLLIILLVTLIKTNIISKIFGYINTQIRAESLENALTYKVYDNQDNNNIKTLLTFNPQVPIEYILKPDGTKINGNGKSIIYLDYTIALNEKKIFKIKPINSNEVTNTLQITENDIKSIVQIIEISSNEEETIVEIQYPDLESTDKLYYKTSNSDIPYQEYTGRFSLDMTDIDIFDSSDPTGSKGTTTICIKKVDKAGNVVLIKCNREINSIKYDVFKSAIRLGKSLDEYGFNVSGANYYNLFSQNTGYFEQDYAFNYNANITIPKPTMLHVDFEQIAYSSDNSSSIRGSVTVYYTDNTNEYLETSMHSSGTKTKSIEINIEQNKQIQSVKIHLWGSNGKETIKNILFYTNKEAESQVDQIFYYTGTIQSTRLTPGRYKLEVWGAQGGNAGRCHGGYGGYSTGEITITSPTTLYIVVGGQGKTHIYRGYADGGYNGGGKAYSDSWESIAGGGGGATHIATQSGLLSELSNNTSSVIIVAGGGGGASGYGGGTPKWTNGGNGGGNIGGYVYHRDGVPTQTFGYFLGHGGLGESETYNGLIAGGGSGWYGAFAYGPGWGACGGSGYINPILNNKYMMGMNVEESSDENTKTYNISNTSLAFSSPTADSAKKEDGAARITRLSSNTTNNNGTTAILYRKTIPNNWEVLSDGVIIPIKVTSTGNIRYLVKWRVGIASYPGGPCNYVYDIYYPYQTTYEANNAIKSAPIGTIGTSIDDIWITQNKNTADDGATIFNTKSEEGVSVLLNCYIDN